MDPPFCVKYLTESEVDYELRIRNVRASRKTLETKRLILGNLLKKLPLDVLSLKDPGFDSEEERTIINITIAELGALVHDFSASKDDTSYLIINNRLTCLTNRIHRFIVPDEPEEVHVTFLDFKDDALASCHEIEAKLELKIIPKQENIVPSVANPSVKKSIPVFKWGIQYDGKTSLKAFLERVNELSTARNVSEEQLFDSAIDLFVGPPLILYRSLRNKISSWQELVAQLELAFLPPEYDDQLLDEIKARKQGHSEPTGIFVATMQNLFSRLATKLSEDEKLKIIRRNILPKYIDALALSDIKNTVELLSLSKKVDLATLMKNNYRPSIAKNCLLEADLAYVDTPGPSQPKNKQFNFKNNSNKNLNKKTQEQNNAISNVTNDNKSSIICWNCRKTGHSYTVCKAPRKRFCFSCGKHNYTTKTCPVCKSKN